MNSPKAELRHPRSLAGPAKSVFRPIPQLLLGQFCLLPSKFSSVTAKAPPEKKARSADAAESRVAKGGSFPKLESRLKHSQEGPPTLGGLSFTIVLLQKPRPCDCPWAPGSSTGQRIRQPLASICLQLSFPIVFLYSEVCGWPKVFALLSPVFGLHWLEGSFFGMPKFCMSCCASKQTHLRRPPLECQPATQWKSVFTGDGMLTSHECF